MESERYFNLGAILNITTGRLFTSIDDIYNVLNYLTGEDLTPQQVPTVMEEARDYILSIYPELEGVGETVRINSSLEGIRFLKKQKNIYGKKLSLKPMNKEKGYIK